MRVPLFPRTWTHGDLSFRASVRRLEHRSQTGFLLEAVSDLQFVGFSVHETNDQRSTRWLDPLTTNESHTASVYDTARMMTRESTRRKEVPSLSLSLFLSRSLCPSLLLFSFSRLPRRSCRELLRNPNQTQIERKRERWTVAIHIRVLITDREMTPERPNCRRGSTGNVLPLCPDSWRVVCLDCPPAPGT